MVKRISAALVLISGCGLLPSSEALAPFPSDGVAGFGEVSPIEVCLGAARVAAPGSGSGAGAVCVPEGASGEACGADGDCDGIERCLCGRCIVEVCDGVTDCGEGRVCRGKRCTLSCSTSADCPAGEVCDAGGCARGCGDDADCHFGERCDAIDNTCVAKPCGGAVSCGAGRRCEPAAITASLREPEVIEAGGADVAFVEVRVPGEPAAIYRATVDAPDRWTIDPEGPVITAAAGAGGPSALVEGDRIDLYFGLGDGSAIRRATSTDGGRTFTAATSPVLTAAGGWEQGFLGSPAIVRFQGALYLLYEGGPGAGIGIARVEGDAASRLSDAPILAPESVGDALSWRDLSAIGAPAALVTGGALRVYFTGRGVEGRDAVVGGVTTPAGANDSIGLAASLDAVHFSLYPGGPVLARVTNLRTYLGEREAVVRLREGGPEIVFVSADASGEHEAGLARAGD